MLEQDSGDHIKEVYARFGLAVYCAQVLEHGLVNALVILDLVPSRRHLARSKADWAGEVDTFMGTHFRTTMGRMMKSLHAVTQVDNDLEALLNEALEKRNWLVHHFFRDSAVAFMSATGREQMLRDIDQCRELFESADERLGMTVRPLRESAGLTDDVLEGELQRLLLESET